MTLLGPGVIFASPPFCTGDAFHACRHAGAKWAARIGLVLAAAELLFLVALMSFGLFDCGGG